MIIKFCYQNEIHRCSDPPSDFTLLKSFLAKMFQANLPRNFVLSYVNPEGESFPLESKEDYEALQSKGYSKPVKVVITEVQGEIEDDQISEYEMIAEGLKAEKEVIEDKLEEKIEEEEEVPQRVEELKDLLEDLTEELTKVHVVPKVEKLEGEIPQEEQVRRIVREALEEQMPFIISRIQANSIQESMRSVQSDYNVDVAEQDEQKKPLQYNWKQMGFFPYYQSILQSIPDEMKVAAHSQAQSQAEPQPEKEKELPEVNDVAQEEGEQREEEKERHGRPTLLKKMTKALAEFPMKAADFVDNLTHKISGDPYVECEEGRYPKSVVEKVENLKEVFEEADKKELLDFVSKLPKEFPLFQVGDLFAMHKKMD